jgi:hypothetical protein
MLPVLVASAAGEIRVGDAVERLAEQLHLIPNERTQLLPSGKQTLFGNRVHSPPKPAMPGCSIPPADHLALPLTRDGDPQPAQIEDTDAAFAIGWTGHYHIDGPAFIYIDQRSGRMATILGYPTQKLTQKPRT